MIQVNVRLVLEKENIEVNVYIDREDLGGNVGEMLQKILVDLRKLNSKEEE